MKLTNPSNAGTEIVKLIVGPEAKEFSLHKNFACQGSEMMKSAFCGEFAEGKTGVMTLVDADPIVCITLPLLPHSIQRHEINN